jgi:hypothetical protein
LTCPARKGHSASASASPSIAAAARRRVSRRGAGIGLDLGLGSLSLSSMVVAEQKRFELSWIRTFFFLFLLFRFDACVLLLQG